MLRENIINDLVCPVGKFPLNQNGDMLECTNCGAKYPVKESIPILLIDDAILPEGVNEIHELKCFKEKNNTPPEGT